MRVSPISTNVRTFIKTNIAKQTAKKSAVLLSASGLAAILLEKDFINKTNAGKLEFSGHWETHYPMDSSDYYYQRWVEDKPQQYIPGSGCPDDYNNDDYNDDSGDSGSNN